MPGVVGNLAIVVSALGVVIVAAIVGVVASVVHGRLSGARFALVVVGLLALLDLRPGFLQAFRTLVRLVMMGCCGLGPGHLADGLRSLRMLLGGLSCAAGADLVEESVL